jgi:hypothetical protein
MVVERPIGFLWEVVMKRERADRPPSKSAVSCSWQSVWSPDAVIRLTPLLKSLLAALEVVLARAPIWGNAFLPTYACAEPFRRFSELVQNLGLEQLDPSGPPVAADVRISHEFDRFGERAKFLLDGLYYDLFETVWDLKSIGFCDQLPRDGKIPTPSERTMAKLRDVTFRFEQLITILVPVSVSDNSTYQSVNTKVKRPTPWAVDQEIIDTLRSVRHRCTTMKLIDEMATRALDPSESTVKKRLAAMVKEHRLTKDPRAEPPGYGLPEWADGSSGSVGS